MFGHDAVWIFLHTVQVPGQQIQVVLQSVEDFRYPAGLLVNSTPLVGMLGVQRPAQGIQQVLKINQKIVSKP